MGSLNASCGPFVPSACECETSSGRALRSDQPGSGCRAVTPTSMIFARTRYWRRTGRRSADALSRIASVRAPESVIEVRVDVILDDRLQQIRDGGQVLLAKHGKLVQELRSPADICEILSAVRKGEPVVARKGDACSCCRSEERRVGKEGR